MADVVTKELKVRVTVDAQTGQLRVYEADMDKVTKATDRAEKAMAKHEQRLQRQTNGMIKLGAATTGLNTQLGGLPNTLIEVGDKLDMVNYLGVKMSSSLKGVVSQLGLLGTAALVAGAAMAGWKIGRWISDVTGLDKALKGLTDRMLGIGSAADSADAAMAKAMNRAAQAGITNRKLNEDITKANIDAQNKIQEAFMTTTEKLARAQGRMHEILTRDQAKFNADQNRAMEKEYVVLRDLAADYEIEIRQEQQKQQEARTKTAERESEKRKKIAEDEAKKEIEMVHWTDDALKNLTPAATGSQKWMDAFGRSVHEVTIDINDFAPAIENTTAKFKGMEGELTDTEYKVNKLAIAFAKAAATLFTLASGLNDIGNALGGKVGKVISSLGDMFGGAGQFAMGFAEFAINPLQGIMDMAAGGIKAVKGLIDALKDLFGHNWAKDTEKQIDHLLGGLKISDDLMKQITEDAEKFGNAARAALMHLPDIFNELGVNMENFFQMAQAAQDVLSGVEQGIISTSEASDILGDILPQLFEAAIEGGDAYMDRMQELLVMTKQFGIDISDVTDMIRNKIKEMQAAVLEQVGIINEGMSVLLEDLTTRLDAFLATIPEGMGRNDAVMQRFKDDALGYAEIIMQNFDALILGGKSVAEAVAILAPQIDALTPILKKLGLTWADVGGGWIRQMENINKKYSDEVSIINVVTSNLQAMLTAGIDPGRRGFEAMQTSAMDAFARINADGKVSKAELATVKPLLMALAAASLEYGYALDPATIALLKQAGLWDEINNKPDASKVQKQGISDLIDLMTKKPDGLIPTLQRFIDMLMELNGLVVTPTVDVQYNNGGGSNHEEGWFAWQGLRGVHYVTRPVEKAIVHKGEAIVGKDVVAGRGMGSPSITVNIFGGDVNQRLQEIKRWEREGRR